MERFFFCACSAYSGVCFFVRVCKCCCDCAVLFVFFTSLLCVFVGCSVHVFVCFCAFCFVVVGSFCVFGACCVQLRVFVCAPLYAFGAVLLACVVFVLCVCCAFSAFLFVRVCAYIYLCCMIFRCVCRTSFCVAVGCLNVSESFCRFVGAFVRCFIKR